MLAYKFIIDSGELSTDIFRLKEFKPTSPKELLEINTHIKYSLKQPPTVYNMIWCSIEISTESFKYILAQTFSGQGYLFSDESEDHVDWWNWWSVDIHLDG